MYTMCRDVITDDIWEIIGPLFPPGKTGGRPPANRRLIVEATAWRFRTGSPWRDVPERFGNWNTVYKHFNAWAKDGTWTKALAHIHALANAGGEVDWFVSVDSTIARVHQHGATLPRPTGGRVELQQSG